jgi:hypothetical protein
MLNELKEKKIFFLCYLAQTSTWNLIHQGVKTDWRPISQIGDRLRENLGPGSIKRLHYFRNDNLSTALQSFPELLRFRKGRGRSPQARKAASLFLNERIREICQTFLTTGSCPNGDRCRSTHPNVPVKVFPLPSDHIFYHPARLLFEKRRYPDLKIICNEKLITDGIHYLIKSQACFFLAAMKVPQAPSERRHVNDKTIGLLQTAVTAWETIKNYIFQGFFYFDFVHGASLVASDLAPEQHKILNENRDRLETEKQFLLAELNKLIQFGQRKKQSLERSLEPELRERDEVRERMGREYWKNNPNPRCDYAERRRQRENWLAQISQSISELSFIESYLKTLNMKI